MSEKLYEKTEDELKSEIYETVIKLTADEEYPFATTSEIRKEFPDLDKYFMIKLLGKLVDCDKKLNILELGIEDYYYPRPMIIYKKLDGRMEDELKSEICQTVKELSKEDEINGEALEEQIKERFPNVAEDTIVCLLKKLAYCDKKLIEVDRRMYLAYMLR